MARIYPPEQPITERANLVRRLYKLSQNTTIRECGREASRDVTSMTKSVRKLIEAVRSEWPPS